MHLTRTYPTVHSHTDSLIYHAGVLLRGMISMGRTAVCVHCKVGTRLALGPMNRDTSRFFFIRLPQESTTVRDSLLYRYFDLFPLQARKPYL